MEKKEDQEGTLAVCKRMSKEKTLCSSSLPGAKHPFLTVKAIQQWKELFIGAIDSPSLGLERCFDLDSCTEQRLDSEI